MIVEVWESDYSITFCIEGEEISSTDFFLYNPCMTTKIEGDDLNDCMDKYYRLIRGES